MNERRITMHQENRVTEDSPMEPQETKELIERLSDPAFIAAPGRATVKDLAETLDVDPSRVIEGLVQLREEKDLQLSPQVREARAFGTNQPYAKLASVMILAALMVTAICFYFLLQPASNMAPPAPVAAPIKIEGDHAAPMAPPNKKP
jgi:hypothetical protein